MYCFDVIRSLTSADRLRTIDVKQAQNITANKIASKVQEVGSNLASFFGTSDYATAQLYA